jgi:hypothetical protein
VDNYVENFMLIKNNAFTIDRSRRMSNSPSMTMQCSVEIQHLAKGMFPPGVRRDISRSISNEI